MNVTIIGTGNMGRGLSARLAAGGNNVTLVGKTTEAAAKLADELRAAAKNGATIRAAGPQDPIKDDVVILAVWQHDVPALIDQYGEQLAGKILVHIGNPLNETYDGLSTAPGTSAAEELAATAPAGARVVKAFNTTFAGTLAAGQVDDEPLDVLIAGDDADAKAAVARLVESAGMRAVDTGPLSRAQQLEGLGLLHITLQPTLGTNWMSAVKFLP